MATFSEIVTLSEQDRHKVYFLQDEAGNKYRVPKPKKVNQVKELARLRSIERQERAARIASLVHAAGVEKCEELGVNIAGLIEEPQHISLADGSLPLVLNLIRRITEE